MRQLRDRADEDAANPHAIQTAGRHSIDLAELGLRVSLTRARYPNTAAGLDQYAVTISRHALDHRPAGPEVELVLRAAFEQAAGLAVERPSGPLIRMFRIPLASPE